MELEIITLALRKLGEKSDDVKIKVDGDVAAVYVDGEYYGVWSFPRDTFVD